MKAEVQDSGKFEKSVRVEIPAERVEHEYEHVLAELKHQARVPGFRPGKVPETVILRMYSDYIQSHAKQHLINESLPELLEKEDLFPVSEPVIDTDEVSRGKPFTYTARFEVKPAVEAIDYKDLDLKKEKEEVTDERVNEHIEHLREQQAQLQGLPEDHAADLGDTLMVTYEGKLGDTPAGQTEQESPIELGSGRNLPGLDEQLKGLKAGEEKHVRYTLPDDMENEDLAGKKVDLTFHVKSVRRKELPELDDEFAKDLGYEGLDDLKTKIREQMERSAEEQARQKLADQALEKLLEKNEFEVPPSMIDSQAAQLVDQARQRLAMQGLPMNLNADRRDELKQGMREEATRIIRRHLILESIARQENVEVSDADIDAEIEKMAENYGQPADKIRAVYEQQGLLPQLRIQLQQQRALDFVLDKANID